MEGQVERDRASDHDLAACGQRSDWERLIVPAIGPPTTRLGRLITPRRASSWLGQQARVLQSMLVLVSIEVVVILVGEYLIGLSIGNDAGDEYVVAADESPGEILALLPLVAAVEELLFRGIPNWVVDRLPGVDRRRAGMRWPLGVALAIAFAAMHNLTDDPSKFGIPINAELIFSLETLPAPQLVMGLFWWNVARRFGVSHAVASHVLHNLGVAILLVALP